MRKISFFIALILALLVSCKQSDTKSTSSKSRSRTIGWTITEQKEMTGYDSPAYLAQETGPGLVFVEGGTFTMGRVEEDVMKDWNNVPRRVTVSSFYMDETEVTNYDYRVYLSWLISRYPSFPEKAKNALPDTTVWRKALAYNEPLVTNYFRHPAYANYPVVGVSWVQANEFCKWRTDRVNEYILVSKGYLEFDTLQTDANVFTTKGYLSGYYMGTPGKMNKRVKWDEGILLPDYRLPTEAEWEYAALGLIGQADGELLTNKPMYPWEGQYLRDSDKKRKGEMLANFTRGRGDMMGMAGALNDNADIPGDVFSYTPNSYNLYNMAGNVNEWVADVYRPMSSSDVEEFQPFRGNVTTEYVKDADDKIQFDEFGEAVKDTVADYRNYNDGDYRSIIPEGGSWNAPASLTANDSTTTQMYGLITGSASAGSNNLMSPITSEIRVYKGGSWKDRAYWLNPGARRYLDERESASDVGFRCAMSRVGNPGGNSTQYEHR